MTDRQLLSRAEALGVSPSYVNWRQERVEVPAETLTAIIGALGEASRSALPDPPLDGPQQDEPSSGDDARAAAVLPVVPRTRSWGLTVQLYSVRSRRSWGHGDLHDLADLARWSAKHLGADFVLINPLHAAEPAVPISNSPYLPMSRRYVSPLYLRIEDIAEYQLLKAAQRQYVEELAAPLRAASSTPELIDRDRVWSAKLVALETIWRAGRSPARQRDHRRFAEREGADLAAWARWCALAERHGPDWRGWPAEMADSGRAARATASGPLA